VPNFSGISNQTTVGRLLRFPLKLIPAEAKVPILQGRLRGKRWIVGAGEHGCWLGSYEYQKQRLFERTIKPGAIVFDIGANVGFYSLLASTLVGDEGHVFAFEPVPANIFFIKEHLRLNQVANVTVIEQAVSDASGVASFADGASSCTGRLAVEGHYQVRTVSLDELVFGGKMPAPDYMKIDVEGAEMLVLSGARALLQEAHPVIFLATHSSDLHRQCCQFLQSIGYQLQPINGGSLEQTDEVLAYFR